MKGRIVKNAPAFTVLTPSFNQEPFVQATLDNVRQQNFTDFEQLIYVSISTDGSADVPASELADKGDIDATLPTWQAQASACLGWLLKARSRLAIIERSRIAVAANKDTG